MHPTQLEKIMKALKIEPSDLFKIEHLQEDDILFEEIINILKKNPNKIQEFYKILKAII